VRMPLILAIEPDRRQASQLKKLVHSVGAELVLAETTERALDAIGNRIPDLVLVPALLSPQDDAALATALRVIATAAHVQTLTIPVFAAAAPRPRKSGGVLAKLMGDRAHAAVPEGCNPGLFAEQIAAYLAEAEAARAHREYAQEYEPPAPKPIAEPLAAVSSPFDIEPWLDQPAAEMTGLSVVRQPAAEPVYTPAYEAYVPAYEPAYESSPEPMPEPTPDPVAAVDPEPVVRAFEPKPLHIVRAAPELVEEAESEWQPVMESESELEPVQAAAEAASDAQTVAEFDPSDIDLGAFIAELEEQRRAARVEENDDRPAGTAAAIEQEFDAAPDAVAEFDASVTPPPEPQRPWATLHAAGTTRESDTESDSESEPPSEASVEQGDATVVAEIEPAPSDWIDMLEALRRDIDRLRVERTEASLPSVAAAAETSEDDEQAASRRKKRKKEPPPVQDEWGFFDPEQCGFTALLAKLDEISKNDDGGKRSP